jgi:hypothetical protein
VSTEQGGFCHLQGGLAITEENELDSAQDSGGLLEPWMEEYLEHQFWQDCPDCFGEQTGGAR